MSIVLPDWVARNMQREQVLQSADPAQIKYWNRRLKELDPHLALAWAGEFASGPGIVPGRWHIRRKNLVGADTYWAVQTPDGGFREMSSQVLEQFQAADLWNSQVRADRDRSFARAERSADRAKLRARKTASTISAITSMCRSVRRCRSRMVRGRTVRRAGVGARRPRWTLRPRRRS
jgi:hypothetical protein